RYGSLYSLWRTKADAIQTTLMNTTMPATGPTRISALRFIAPFISPLGTVTPSLVRLRGRAASRRRRRGVRGLARGARQPLALELSHVGDDRPPVRRRDWPAVRRHQSL